MAAAMVHKGVSDTRDDAGNLFAGLRFWFSHQVPQRKWLIENAQAHGATIVALEKQADILLVDHARKNQAPGTHSYRYVEQSIRKGRLEDLEDHKVAGHASAVDRPVGSTTIPPRRGRSYFTDAEDQLLWNFIKPFEDAGGAARGNEIYKQLEEAHGNGRHTYQSWRDRWLKNVRYQSRTVTTLLHAPVKVAASTDVQEAPRTPRTPAMRKTAPALVEQAQPWQDNPQPSRLKFEGVPRHPQSSLQRFTEDEFSLLYRAAKHILNTSDDHIDEAWRQLAKETIKDGVHSPRAWRTFFEEEVQPVYEERLRKEKIGRGKQWQRETRKTTTKEKKPAEDESGLSQDASIKAEELENEQTADVQDEDEDSLFADNATYFTESVSVASQVDRIAAASPEEDETPDLSGETGEAKKQHQQRHGPKDDARFRSGARQTATHRTQPRYIDKAVGSSPPFDAENTPNPDKRPRRSPSFLSLSPSMSKPPEPNEARKRTPGKSADSQESQESRKLTESKGVEASHESGGNGRSPSGVDDESRPFIEDLETAILEVPTRLWPSPPDDRRFTYPRSAILSESPELLRTDHDEPLLKRRKRTRSDEEHLEIPSTPEHRQALAQLSAGILPDDANNIAAAEITVMEEGSPTPRLRRYKRLFRSGQDLPKLQHLREIGHSNFLQKEDEKEEDMDRTSEMSIKLVSESDHAIRSSSPAKRRVQDDEEPSSELDPDFETAPDVSEMWATMPEPQRETQRFETAPEHDRGRIDTQALFAQDTVELDDPFALPAPEGGWEAVELGQSLSETAAPLQERRDDHELIPMDSEEEDENDDDASSISSIDAWVNERLLDDPQMDHLSLLKAVRATSASTDRELVMRVYRWLVEEDDVPRNLRGCWTEGDDRALGGGDREDLQRVMVKHGGKGMDQRMVWLELRDEI